MIAIIQIICLVLQLVASGFSDIDAVNSAAKQFGLDPNEIRKYL